MTDLEDKWRDRITDPLKMRGIRSVNFDPHPYMIGPVHLRLSKPSVHLGRAEIIEAERQKRHGLCQWKGVTGKHGKRCELTYEQHTHDTVMFLELTRDTTNSQVLVVLQPLAGEIEEDGIDGFAFVESKFRVREGEE